MKNMYWWIKVSLLQTEHDFTRFSPGVHPESCWYSLPDKTWHLDEIVQKHLLCVRFLSSKLVSNFLELVVQTHVCDEPLNNIPAVHQRFLDTPDNVGFSLVQLPITSPQHGRRFLLLPIGLLCRGVYVFMLEHFVLVNTGTLWWNGCFCSTKTDTNLSLQGRIC